MLPVCTFTAMLMPFLSVSQLAFRSELRLFMFVKVAPSSAHLPPLAPRSSTAPWVLRVVPRKASGTSTWYAPAFRVMPQHLW